MPAVGRVDITAADAVGTAPITSIELSDNGGDPTADDLHDIAAMALKNDADVRTGTNGLDKKVAKAGDTMTGKLTISPSTAVQGLQVSAGAASDQNAIQATGNGIGPAIIGTGGVNAAGASFTAGGGNNFGIRGIGAGTGEGVCGVGGAAGVGGTFLAGGGNNAGVSASGAGTGAGIAATGGATGPGLVAASGTAQTATAPTCAAQFAGHIQLTGADPNTGVDPGASNVLHGANVPKAWCTFDTGYNILDGYNVTSLAHVTGSIYKITFARAMANANYAVTIQQHGAPLGLGATNSSVNAGDFEFVLYKSTDGALGFVTSATRATIVVFGRQ